MQHGSWWIVAALGIVISQLLVIYAWPDAKAGIVLNSVLLFPVVFAWSNASFQHETNEQVRKLFSGVSSVPAVVVTTKALQPLPAPVRRWLEVSSVVGKPIPRTVRLKQRGLMRISPDQDYQPAEADQYFRVDKPGFIWRVRVRMMHIVPIAGRDTYIEGQGRMLIKAASLIPLVDASDEKINQGALLRFLGEIVWFPAAALSPYIRWESINATSAKATMAYQGASGSAIFSFNEHGRFLNMSADRYMGGGPDAQIERWLISATNWKEMDGCLVPVQGNVVWKLYKNDFSFYRWEITEIEYDQPELYIAE